MSDEQSEGMEALNQSLNDHMQICSLKHKVKRLEAKVKRLIEAGDKLGSALILFELKSEEERQERLENWANAKYGKRTK
jgi:hypothetical protein